MLMIRLAPRAAHSTVSGFHSAVHTMRDVTKNTLETTLAVLIGIVKTAPSSLAVNRTH